MLDPRDPFFEGTIRNIIQQELAGSRLEVLVRQLQGRFAFGVSPSFTWSGTNATEISVPHGMGFAPKVVVPSSGRYNDAVSGDARAPWLTTIGAVSATNFVLRFNTKNDAFIGAFTVAAGACYWVAAG